MDNFRFSFEMFAKAFQQKSNLDTDTKEWEALVKAIEVRHRITHPRSDTDLEVTLQEMRYARTASEWYRDKLSQWFGRKRGE